MAVSPMMDSIDCLNTLISLINVELGINVEGVQKWKITKRGAWNKRGRGGGTKYGKSINVKGGIFFVEGGIS